MPFLTTLPRTALVRVVSVLVLFALAATACATQEDQGTSEFDSQPAPEVSDPDATESPRDEDADAASPPNNDQDAAEPQRYIPAGRPGNAQDYDEMLRRLAQEVPADLRAEVPWPDLRNADPVEAQISIFELWIWMAANHPEPLLVEAMSAPGSPSREEITSVFGRLEADNVLETRTGAGYRAFDHLVVTFESAGLPLWLARDVPADAVVVYYSDNAGPVDVTDRETGAALERRPAVPTRTWLSIMVPTNVGWQLWRDQLIEPNDSEFDVPDLPPPPGADEDRRDPEV